MPSVSSIEEPSTKSRHLAVYFELLHARHDDLLTRDRPSKSFNPSRVTEAALVYGTTRIARSLRYNSSLCLSCCLGVECGTLEVVKVTYARKTQLFSTIANELLVQEIRRLCAADARI